MPHPADELRAAATRLRTLATAATEAPWTRWHDQEHIPGWDGFLLVGDATVPTEDDGGNPVARVYVDTDAAWIVAMHPGVGLALADWLDAEAAALDHSTHPGWQATVAPHALAVARAVLGGEAAR